MKKTRCISIAKQKGLRGVFSLAFLKLELILMLCVSGLNLSAQTTEQVMLQTKIADASINSAVRIGSYDWYVVKKESGSEGEFAMLVTKTQLGSEISFINRGSSAGNQYGGSYLQKFIREIYVGYMPKELKNIAVKPDLGNDHYSKTVVTKYSTQMAGTQTTDTDIMFALSFKDVQDWNRSSHETVSEYTRNWWTRTGDGTKNVWEVGTQTPNSIEASNYRAVVAGIWVKYNSSDYMLTYYGNGNTEGTTPAAESFRENHSVAVALPGTLKKSGCTFMGWAYSPTASMPDFVYAGGTCSPAYFSIKKRTKLYAIWKEDGVPSAGICRAGGTLLYKQDFGGNNIFDPKVSPTGLTDGSSMLAYNYSYLHPKKGYYLLTKDNAIQWLTPYYSLSDHTHPNDKSRGYMMFLNPGTFDDDKVLYRTDIHGLCGGTKLSFSVWLVNVNKAIIMQWYPRIRLEVLEQRTGKVIYATDEIVLKRGDQWQQHAFTIQLESNVSDITFRIINLMFSTVGNDWAMDDIEIRLCAPPVTVDLQTVEEICENNSFDLEGRYSDDGTFGKNLSYRWEYSSSGDVNNQVGWKVVPGSQGTTTNGTVRSKHTIHSLKLEDGGYYRLVVGTAAGINSRACRAVSDVVQLRVKSASLAGSIRESGPVRVNSKMTMKAELPNGIWTSLNPEIAMINPYTGEVLGMAQGIARIVYKIPATGRDKCGGTTSMDIIVHPLDPGIISAPGPVQVGSTITMNKTVEGGTWKSSDEKIATVDPITGVVTGVSAGVVTIIYTVHYNGSEASATAPVTVIDMSVDAITVSSSLCVGSTVRAYHPIANGTWGSGDNTIATIDPSTGEITGLKAGVVTITYNAKKEGVPVSTDIQITIVDAGSISAPNAICVGSQMKMNHTATGGTWTSEDTEIATIDPSTGEVTGVRAGVATIVYTLSSGCRTWTTVEVGEGPILWTPEANAENDKHNWHNPNNWTPAIVPLPCHDVYIPGNSAYYPKLTSSAVCRDIYFIQGAELGRPDWLTYEKAHVQLNVGLKQMPLSATTNKDYILKDTDTQKRMQYAAGVSTPIKRERWYMLSSPLKGVLTGDLAFGGFPLTFLMKFDPVKKENQNYSVGNWSTPYTSMTDRAASAITDAFAFYMYGYDLQGDSLRNLGCREVGAFSALNDLDYLPNRGSNLYGLWDTNGILELPFFDDLKLLYAHRTQEYDPSSHTSTFYSIGDGTLDPQAFNHFIGTSASIAREKDNGNYRFATEVHNPVNQQWIFLKSVSHFTADLNEGDEFLVGNPYVSSIDMLEFYKDNQSTIYPEFKIWDGVDFISSTVKNQTVVSTAAGDMRYVAPWQGFFLKYKEGKKIDFNVEKISTVRPVGSTFNLKSANEQKEENILRIQSENDFAASYALIGHDDKAGDGYVPGEDVKKLFSSFDYVPSIYSLAGDVPVDIRWINNNKEVIVPLGIRIGQTGEIRLTFTGMDYYFKASKIELIDALENRTIDLTGKSSYTYAFDHQETGIQNGRFSLRFKNLTTAIPQAVHWDDLKVYGYSKGIYVVSSPFDPVQQLVVYDLQGRKMYESTENAKYYPLQENLDHLPLIVKVVTQNRTKTIKLNRNE
ncbi:MAG: Ig-like domain-containing protein [Candidatus Azobacteroides sp.]|nr:Ig-like domain-containing protein [Candidatus Azobacteroides sp.]